MKSKKKAKQLLDHVKQNKSTNWNELGELLYDRRVVPSSNLTDLLSAAVKNKRKANLPGWREFASVLPEWQSLD